MTSPEPPRPRTRIVSGTGVEEKTLHLPTTAPGTAARRTAPSPYPPRAPFQPPPPPRPAPAPGAARPGPQRWEGIGFRPDIQGLRAVAVMLVLLSHAGFAFAPGGYVGVDVFFVISGFLITSLLVKELFDTGGISLAGFFSRRARRILPAATVVTVATVLGVWLWYPITRFEEVMRDAFTVVTYVVNYRFVIESNEYLNADQMPSPFQQYWSLAVEEQFYLLWPLMLLILLVMVNRIPRQALHAAIALTVAVLVLSLIASVLVTESNRSTAYYATHTRAWELAGGALLALTLPAWRRTPRFIAHLLGVAGLAAVVASAVAYDGQTAFPGYTALLPVAGTMLLIVAGTARGKNLVSSVLATGPFQFVGKISYSLYLWHWPVLILSPLALDVEPSLLFNVILLLCTFALAQLSYQYIETPIRNARFLKANHSWGLATGVACSLLAIGMIITLSSAGTGSGGSPVDLDTVEERDDLTQLQMELREAIGAESVPEGLVPSLEAVGNDSPVVYEDGCHLEFDSVSWPENCTYGDVDSDVTVVLMGDSHAAQWFPALNAVAEDKGWKLLPRTKSSCTPVDTPIDNTIWGREYHECEQARGNIFDEIDSIQPDLVIFAGYETTEMTGRNGEAATDRWIEGWESTIERVGASAAGMVVIADTLEASESIPDCVDAHRDTLQDCNMSIAENVREPERRERTMERQQELGVDVIDPLEWFCYEGICPVVVDGVLVYRDSNHVTTPYSRALSPLLASRLPEL